MDQRFHRLLHLAALGRDDLAVEARDRARGHVAQALLDDARRLIDFLHADHEAVVAVAARADRNVDFHRGLGVIGLRLAAIPLHAAAANTAARRAPRHA